MQNQSQVSEGKEAEQRPSNGPANEILMQLNVGLGVLGLMGGAVACEFQLVFVLFFGFYLINLVIAVMSRGIVCQSILLCSSLAFPFLFLPDYINAFYINPDAQSGLVFLLGPAYSILMIPFWIAAILCSKPAFRWFGLSD